MFLFFILGLFCWGFIMRYMRVYSRAQAPVVVRVMAVGV